MMKPSTAVPFALAAALCASAAAGESRPSPDAAQVLAVVDGQPITRAEIEAAAGARLIEVRNHEYTVLRQVLDETINRRLFEKEASRRQVSLEELIRQEIETKAAPVTAEEQKKFYDENKGQFGPMPEAEALKSIEARLKQQRVRTRGIEYVGLLRAQSGVKVSLEPPRFPGSATADDPSKGPADAPVTVVEFSDFECPYCSRVVPVLKKIEERYGNKVRVVFRDLPLVQMHKNAGKAAEAASCAHEQGKFWEMHDRLFANQAALSVADLKKSAVDLGLRAEAFNQCLDSGRFTAEWKADAADAGRYGIGGTPAFLVNGRLLTGVQPFEALARIIDEELERAAVPPTVPAK